MITLIEGLPAGVLGIELQGKITHEDYTGTLIPQAEKLIETYGEAKILCVVGEDWDGYELSAMWDDARFGIKHWSEFSHIALVSDESWLQGMTTFFAPLFPCEVKLFKLDALGDAKTWISNNEKRDAA